MLHDGPDQLRNLRTAFWRMARLAPYFSVAFAVSAVAAIYWSSGLPDDEHDFFEYLCWFLVGGAAASLVVTAVAHHRAPPDYSDSSNNAPAETTHSK